MQTSIDQDIGKIFERPDSSYHLPWVVKLASRDGLLHLLPADDYNANMVKSILDTVFYLLYATKVLSRSGHGNGTKDKTRKTSSYSKHISNTLRRIAKENPEMPRRQRMQTAVNEWKEHVAIEKETSRSLKAVLEKML